MKGIRKFCLIFLVLVLVMPSRREVAAAQEPEWEGYIKSSSYNPNPVAPYSIIDEDTRDPVENTHDYPYSAVARLRVRTKCDCYYFEGSGFMVSKNCMLTAGHVLNCKKHNKGIEYIVVEFGCKKDSPLLLSYTITSDNATIYYNPDFKKSSDYDYGYIVFNTDIGNTTGWYGLLGRSSVLATALAADGALIGSNIAVTGYVQTTLYYGEGVVHGTLFPSVQYQVDTENGESGGPVTFAGGSYAFAIHSAGIPEDSDRDYNTGWRITQEFMEMLARKGYIEITK